MNAVFAKAPLRISLGGGGTDLPSYYERHDGFLVAGAINKYVYMLLHEAFQSRWLMHYSENEEVAAISEIRHPILREALLRHWPDGKPLHIASVADVPKGTGLGSSGSFTVCLLKALARARQIALSPGRLAEAAASIEIDALHQPVGKQDPYAAAHGGICAYTFHADGAVTVEPVDLPGKTLAVLDERLLLYSTGKTRAASGVLADQDAKTKACDEGMLANLHATKALGHEALAHLLDGDVDGYGDLLHTHWMNKRERSPGMSTDDIDDLYAAARRGGALGGKLVGAGGGGFLLLYTRKPDKTRGYMQLAGATELPFTFEFGGAVASSA